MGTSRTRPSSSIRFDSNREHLSQSKDSQERRDQPLQLPHSAQKPEQTLAPAIPHGRVKKIPPPALNESPGKDETQRDRSHEECQFPSACCAAFSGSKAPAAFLRLPLEP